MDYTQIDKAEQLAQVRARMRELEQQHLAISLRLQAPNVNNAPNGDQDQSQLTKLEASINALRAREQTLTSNE